VPNACPRAGQGHTGWRRSCRSAGQRVSERMRPLGGSAGSNPVGATIQHQHDTAADQQEQGSAAVFCVRSRQRLRLWRLPLADPSTVEALTSRMLGE
jgi:hypothetical protein